MSKYQSKIREARKILAKKKLEQPKGDRKVQVTQVVGKDELEQIYMRFNSVYESIGASLDKLSKENSKSAKDTQAKLTDLNNSIVGVMQKLTDKSVKLENIDELKKALEVTEVKVTNPDEIKAEFHESTVPYDEITKNLANIADQLGSLEPVKQGQEPSDFVPFRRVIQVGNRLEFDDTSWSGARGGGGSSGGGIDISTLATHAKQDEIITAIQGIVFSPDTPLDKYTYIQKDTSGDTYKYYGYADANTAGAWAIKRITIATNLAEFITGASDYSTAWGDRATQTYADIWSTF